MNSTKIEEPNLFDGYVVPVDPMDDLQCESCQ
ncbi:hypothetical protein SAMN04515680_1018 [Leifsonia sp. 21MFCrub1.1]|nr:hypothetical protein SAMN04515680_1018 [Leifsonia sp. 21MFCrub1.1]